MMSGLASRDRRAVLVGGVIALSIIGWAGLARPFVRAVSAANATLQHERALLEREEGLIVVRAERPQLARDARAQLSTVAPRFWPVSDAGIAHAALATYLQRSADSVHVLVTQVEATAPMPLPSGVAGIPLRVHGQTDFQGLVDYLTLLGSGPRLVRVTQLDVVATSSSSDRSPVSGPPPMPGARSMPQSGPAGAAEVLAFQLMAVGYLLPLPPSFTRGVSRDH